MLTKEDIIWAYQLFLNRLPESEDVVAQHLQKTSSMRELCERFMLSKEFQDKIALQTPIFHDDQIFNTKKNITFSQHGEDKIFELLLTSLFKTTHPCRYLDIGSNDPVKNSNTYLFYINGGSGVLCEPNPIFKLRTAILRPRDTFYNAGIAFDDARSAIYYDFGENSGLNTFSESVGENVEKNWKHMGAKLKRKVSLPLLDVNEILEKHFKNGLDLLSIDVEGLDFAIVKLINFELFRPKLLCMEADMANIRRQCGDNNLISYLNNNGYLWVATTHANLVFADSTRIQHNDFLSLKAWGCPS